MHSMTSNRNKDIDKVQSGSSFTIDAPTFEVIYQLTKEIPNFRKSLMSDPGWTSEIEKFLLDVVRSVPRDLDPTSWVRIAIVEDTGTFPAQPPRPALPLAAGEEAVRDVPRQVSALWPRLLDVVWANLGPLEARYRTGYREPEIVGALATFTAVINSALEG